MKAGTRQRVLLVGPLSSVGGINVHLSRLARLLKDDIAFDFIDDAPPRLARDPSRSVRRYASLFNVLTKMARSDVVHIHSGNWILRILLIIASRLCRAKVIVTIHSYRISGIKRLVSNLFMRFAVGIICVSGEIAIRMPREVIIREAFIPPEEGRRQAIPDEVARFITDHRGSIIICANASRLVLHEGGDLYGLDQCVALARRAKEQGEKIAIIFVVGAVFPEDDLFFAAVDAVREQGLGDLIMIYSKGLDFVSLIKASDIVLRPTLTDGDALTIREGLYFGKVVIASDVVARPKGTLLYSIGGSDALYDAVKRSLPLTTVRDGVRSNLHKDSSFQYRSFYLEVYRNCLR